MYPAAAAAVVVVAMKAAFQLLSPLLCLLLLGHACVADEVAIEEEDGVLVLKAANFEQALKEHPDMLVEFCESLGEGREDRSGVCVCMVGVK